MCFWKEKIKVINTVPIAALKSYDVNVKTFMLNFIKTLDEKEILCYNICGT